MSLLNDVLRELADQHQTSRVVVSDTQVMLPQAPIIQPKHFLGVAGLALFIVVFVAVLFIQHIVHKNSIANHLPITNQSAVDKTVAPTYSRVERQVVSPVIAEEKKHSDDVLSAEIIKNTDAILQAHIAELMQQAERAVTMDRLTAPIEDNAYAYYQKILTFDAAYIPAKKGLENIARLYLAKSEEQEQLGNHPLAETFLQRAKIVAPDFVASQPEKLHSEHTNIASSIDTKNHLPDANTDAATIPQHETIKPFPVAEAASVEVVSNSGWKDEQMAQHAKDLMQEGKLQEAQIDLKEFIANQKRPVQSAMVLADIYLQQKNDQAAMIILEHADYLSAVDKAQIKAQALSMQGDDANAIAILEQNLSAADNHEKYRSLLASLYHKTGNYQQSVLSYQRLLSSFGEKPAYWLGLALAFDGLSQHKSALQTYKHLREFPQLQAQVKNYIDQRIAVLQSE